MNSENSAFSGNFVSAIEEWTKLLGADRVSQEDSELQRLGSTCLPYQNSPIAVLRPQTSEDVRAICRIASKHRVSLYSISRGKNWGYGSASPSAPNCVLLDLSELNRIVELNTDLAYVVVEPGVTQQQLYDHLCAEDIDLEFDVTGAPPDASLLANILERGYGQTPYSDHFQHASFMEVVLADGTLLRTGFGHFPNEKIACIQKWGLGPYLDGIFTQSNLGIVVKVGIWLMPKPKYFGVFSFGIRDDRQLAEVVDRMRKLRLNGTLRSAVHFGNDIRVLSALQVYPWKEAKGITPLPEELRRKLLARWQIDTWYCGGGLRGERAEVRLRLKQLRKELKGLVRVRFISERQIRIIKSLSGIYQRIAGVDLSEKLAIFGLMRGVPSERPTRGVYWRMKGEIPKDQFDPPRDGCGFLWCSPIIPMTRTDVSRMLETLRTTCDEFGFETNLSLNLLTERAACAVIGILFNKDDTEEAQQAARCHAALLERFADCGYYPYRFGSQIQEAHRFLFSDDDVYWQVVRSIKQALDPNGILAPGRYGI